MFIPSIYLQDEGVEAVLDNLEAVGVTAIALNLAIGRPAVGQGGTRFPDLHIDGHQRVVTRPIWGQHALEIESFHAYEPDVALYAEGPYVPTAQRRPAELLDTDVVPAAIASARQRGMEVHLVIQPLIVPGLRDEDRPKSLATDPGSAPVVADSACPANPAARAYARGLVRDTAAQFGTVDGIVLDWAEYRSYSLPDLFGCVCTHCETAALASGESWAEIIRELKSTLELFHRLTRSHLRAAERVQRSPGSLIEYLLAHPGWLALARVKSRTILDIYREARDTLDRDDHRNMQLTARGWSPPWNLISGLDYGGLTSVCQSVAPKIFTFDYAALPRWWGEILSDWNPTLSEGDILDALVELFQLPDDIAPRTFQDYHIPSPSELHPTDPENYADRIAQVVDRTGGRIPVRPIIHAYLPEPQWQRMVAVVRDGPADGAWVQMYGYLSDAKLRTLGETWKNGADSYHGES